MDEVKVSTKYQVRSTNLNDTVLRTPHFVLIISPVTPFFVSAKKSFLSKQLKIFLNYVVGPVVFLWLGWTIYQQMKHQPDLHQSWEFIKSAFTGAQAWKPLLVVVLMVVHWNIEAYKWRLLVQHIQPISYKRACRSVLSGQAIAFNTPNRLGDSVGRAIFLEEGNRLRGIALSFVGSTSQLVVYFVAGLIALLYLKLDILETTKQTLNVSTYWYNGFVMIVTVGTGLLLLLYYRISWIIRRLERISFVKKHRYLVQELENFRPGELTRILLLSASRYVIYMVQYVLLLQVFEVQVSALDTACIVSVMFLVLAIVPSITLAELGLRGKIGLVLFGLLSMNSVGIVAVMAGIWIINLIIPAVIGSLFILGLRLFRK